MLPKSNIQKFPVLPIFWQSINAPYHTLNELFQSTDLTIPAQDKEMVDSQTHSKTVTLNSHEMYTIKLNSTIQ